MRRERVHRVEIVGELDAHAAEEFSLEIQRVAKHFRSEVRTVRSPVGASGRKSRLA